MSDESGAVLNVTGLQKFAAALKDGDSIGRIGILGGKASALHADDVGKGEKIKKRNLKKATPEEKAHLPTNVEIGVAHEFGTDKLPMRSFLRMPLIEKLNKELEKTGMFSKQELAEVVQTRTVKPWLKKVMIVAEAVVMDAFATGGFGNWKPSNMKRKKNHQTLVESQQLRNSITTEVK